jgi:hypothetical protein
MRTLFALTLAAACFTVTAAAQTLAGTKQPLHVKTGLWQVTQTSSIGGGIPPEMEARLAQMPPEQRARVEAMMQNRFGGAPQTTTFKSCVTEKDLNSEPWQNGTQCKWTVLHSDGTDMEARGTECNLGKEQGMSSEIHIKIHVVDSGNVNATFDGSATQNGHTFTLSGTHTAKWLGATCPADVE